MTPTVDSCYENRPTRQRRSITLAVVLVLALTSMPAGSLTSCSSVASARVVQEANVQEADRAPDERAQLVDSIRRSLQEDLLDAWYPRVIDEEHGGYLSDFTHEWEAYGEQDKFIVTQARHVWTLARAAEFFPERRESYLSAAAHGVEFLREKMWDAEHGGFVSLVTRTGEVKSAGNSFTLGKTAYGNAFALYGLAAYHDVSGDTAALELARQSFRWIDEHMHDPEYGGFFQFVEPDGTPRPEGLGDTPPKDQNSSIHLLEAFTEFYNVWPDPTLRDRLEEMLVLVRDTMTHEDGYLRLFFERDWTPVSHRDSSEAFIRANLGLDHVSYGHDVETAYLMLEAAHALGIDPTPTLAVGKGMVDHALAHGWDDEYGGFVDAGYYFNPAGAPETVRNSKAWWAQAEALNTMLMMEELYPDDARSYGDHFESMWAYIEEHLIDHEHGGWFVHGLDASPEARTEPKAGIWKGAYHDARALMNVVSALSGRAPSNAE